MPASPAVRTNPRRLVLTCWLSALESCLLPVIANLPVMVDRSSNTDPPTRIGRTLAQFPTRDIDAPHVGARTAGACPPPDRETHTDFAPSRCGADGGIVAATGNGRPSPSARVLNDVRRWTMAA